MTIKVEDVTQTLEIAVKTSGCNQANVVHKPRLLSDNGYSYISGDLANWPDEKDMDHIRRAANHPQTLSKV